MNKYLYQLEKSLKSFILTYLIVISCGVLVGLTYLSSTTNLSPAGTVTRFNGSDDSSVTDELDIKDSYAKPISEMLIISFGSIWGMRFIDYKFVYLAIISSTLMYSSFFIMTAVSMFELMFKKT